MYHLFDHTADLGMEIYGDDGRALFANAAKALFDVLVSPVAGGDAANGGEAVEAIEVTGEDWPDLMVNWLRELLYLWAGRQRLLVGLDIDFMEEKRIRARLATCEFDPRRHTVEKEIKAVTYHRIEAGPHGRRWRARVIFDT
jgi:SHS2 domain-containing protein